VEVRGKGSFAKQLLLLSFSSIVPTDESGEPVTRDSHGYINLKSQISKVSLRLMHLLIVTHPAFHSILQYRNAQKASKQR